MRCFPIASSASSVDTLQSDLTFANGIAGFRPALLGGQGEWRGPGGEGAICWVLCWTFRGIGSWMAFWMLDTRDWGLVSWGLGVSCRCLVVESLSLLGGTGMTEAFGLLFG